MESRPSTPPSQPLVEITPDEFFMDVEAKQASDALVATMEQEAANIGHQREGSAHDANVTAGKRLVTDPNSPEAGIRPSESTTATIFQVPRLIGWVARRNTVHATTEPKFIRNGGGWVENPNYDRAADGWVGNNEELGQQLAQKEARSEASIATGGLFTQARGILATRRNHRQTLRQERSMHAEKMYGTNAGRGKKASIGTKINHAKIWLDANGRYRRGEVSADGRREMIQDKTHFTRSERNDLLADVTAGDKGRLISFKNSYLTRKERRALLDKIEEAKELARRHEGREDHEEYAKKASISQAEYDALVGNSGRKYTTTKAVRQVVRRERAGAAYNHLRAKQPITKAIEKRQRATLEEEIEQERAEPEAFNDERIEQRLAQNREESRAEEATTETMPTTPETPNEEPEAPVAPPETLEEALEALRRQREDEE